MPWAPDSRYENRLDGNGKGAAACGARNGHNSTFVECSRSSERNAVSHDVQSWCRATFFRQCSPLRAYPNSEAAERAPANTSIIPLW